MNLTKFRIFWNRFGLYCAAQSPRKRPFKSRYLAVKPLSDSFILGISVRGDFNGCKRRKSRDRGDKKDKNEL